MVKDMRVKVYSAILDRPMQYFSKKEHSAGELSGMLSEDMKSVSAASIETYLLLIQGIMGMITGVIVAFTYNWMMGVVSVIVMPIFFIFIYLQAAERRDEKKSESGFGEHTRIIVSDCIHNYVTVSSLANEETLIGRNCHIKHSLFQMLYETLISSFRLMS